MCMFCMHIMSSCLNRLIQESWRAITREKQEGKVRNHDRTYNTIGILQFLYKHCASRKMQDTLTITKSINNYVLISQFFRSAFTFKKTNSSSHGLLLKQRSFALTNGATPDMCSEKYAFRNIFVQNSLLLHLSFIFQCHCTVVRISPFMPVY